MMAIRRIRAKCEQVSRRGRVRLLGNSWYSRSGQALEVEIKPGRVYQFILDDTARRIIEIHDLSKRTDTGYIESLMYLEIDRLERWIEILRGYVATAPGLDTVDLDVYLSVQAGKGRIDPISLKGEIEHFIEVRDAAQETGYHAGRESKQAKPKAFETYRENAATERLNAATASGQREGIRYANSR